MGAPRAGSPPVSHLTGESLPVGGKLPEGEENLPQEGPRNAPPAPLGPSQYRGGREAGARVLQVGGRFLLS